VIINGIAFTLSSKWCRKRNLTKAPVLTTKLVKSKQQWRNDNSRSSSFTTIIPLHSCLHILPEGKKSQWLYNHWCHWLSTYIAGRRVHWIFDYLEENIRSTWRITGDSWSMTCKCSDCFIISSRVKWLVTGFGLVIEFAWLLKLI
jgi:hypothetical protein